MTHFIPSPADPDDVVQDDLDERECCEWCGGNPAYCKCNDFDEEEK